MKNQNSVGIAGMVGKIRGLEQENKELKMELAKYKTKEILNPCRICGSKDLDIRGLGFSAYIKCSKCNNTRGGFSEREILIKTWNRENE